MIYVIGIGIDGKRSLTDGRRALVDGAGLVVGGRRHLDEFPEARGRKATLKGLPEAAALIRAHLKGGRGHVAVLATGDPLLFGIGSFMLREFGKGRVDIVPNVSAVQEAFARIKEDMNGVKVLSVHGREADFDGLAREAARNPRLAIFTDTDNNPARLSRELLKRGFSGRRAFVCEALGTAREKVTEGTLESVARRRSFAGLNVFILIGKGAGTQGGPFGIPDGEFRHSSGMITKEEMRVVALSKLAVGPASVVWDVGACSGSVAIEAARLTSGEVFAVEKDPARVEDIKENSRRFKAANLNVVKGRAPEALRGLPAPDAVFVGGGGEGIPAILSFVSRRLKKGGRLVVSAVTLETASRAFDFVTKKGWERELVVVNVSRSKTVAGLTMLSANNPLFIISGRRPG